jgi:predicted amidohydrolase YtcJ
VGTNSQIRALARPDTSVYDLKGRLLAPGFNDAHWHFDPSGNIDLSDITSLPELQKRIAEYARSHADKAWITGVGWGYAIFPNRIPDKKYLDTVLADRPVVVWERDGHMALANSKALAVAGITRETPDPEHGRIEHDPSGEPTGEVKETAVDLVARHIPPPTIEERYQALKRIMELAASYGLTSVQNATAEWSDEDQAAFDRMLSEDAVKLRFYVSLPLSKHPASEELARDKSMRDRYRGPLLKFGAVKGFLDGTVDAKTAAMFDPYVGGGTGIPMWTQDDLDRSVALYDREGFQIRLHAIGDKAIHMALDSFEYAEKTNGDSGRPFRVEHAEVPLQSDVQTIGCHRFDPGAVRESGCHHAGKLRSRVRPEARLPCG